MTSSVVGVGSPFGEDQCGWYVIDLLQQHSQLTETSLYKSDRPGLKLIDILRAYQHVIIVDALNRPDKLSQFFELNYKQLQTDSLLSSHGFGVGHAMQLAERLLWLLPRLQIYGVAINFQHSNMSESVTQACERLSHYLLAQLTEDGNNH